MLDGIQTLYPGQLFLNIRFPELKCPRSYVFLLPFKCVRTGNTKVLVVETLYNKSSTFSIYVACNLCNIYDLQ